MNNKMQLFKQACLYMLYFAIFTFLLKYIDVKAIGPEGSSVGFAAINGFFSRILGFKFFWYMISEVLGFIAILLAALYAFLGAVQLFKRKNLFKVDADILVLGVFLLFVFIFYVVFNKVIINYRPVIFEGEDLKASYPSSHTMLSLCVFFSISHLEKQDTKPGFYAENIAKSLSPAFNIMAWLLLLARFLSGMHWFTDIVRSCLLSKSLLHFFYWGNARFNPKAKKEEALDK